jgi:hypothetical protein
MPWILARETNTLLAVGLSPVTQLVVIVEWSYSGSARVHELLEWSACSRYDPRVKRFDDLADACAKALELGARVEHVP